MRVSVTYVGELPAFDEFLKQMLVVSVQGDQIASVAEWNFEEVDREVDSLRAGLFGEFLGMSIHIARHEIYLRAPIGEDCNLVDSDNITAVNESFRSLLNEHGDGVFEPRSIAMRIAE